MYLIVSKTSLSHSFPDLYRRAAIEAIHRTDTELVPNLQIVVRSH
ncbi:hypothetical protein CKA32_003655 [Geitlerinema sp. FC II]|nr:hypothetical protein CKA32_003655 [Geitlerinema sp. FC II]